jgi:hypothetical protein
VLPRGSSFPPPPRAGTRTPRGPVLAVGARAVVTCAAGKAAHVALRDHGERELATVADGEEVEILAWQPHGAGGTRYRVLGRNGEGWLGAVHLRARVLPPPASRGSARPVPAKSPPPVPRSKAKPGTAKKKP